MCFFPLLQSYPNFQFRIPSYQTSGSRKSQNLDIFVHPFPSISSYFHPFHSMSYWFHVQSISSYFHQFLMHFHPVSPICRSNIPIFSHIFPYFLMFSNVSVIFSHLFPYRATASRTSTAASSSSRLTAPPPPRPWSRGRAASWPSAAMQRIRTRSALGSSHGEVFLHRKGYRKMWEDSGKTGEKSGKTWENMGKYGETMGKLGSFWEKFTIRPSLRPSLRNEIC